MQQAQRLREIGDGWSLFLKELPDDLQDSQAADPISAAVPEWLFDCTSGLEYAETDGVSESPNKVMKELVWPLIVSQIDNIENIMNQRSQNGSSWFLANQRPRVVLGYLWEIRKLLAWVRADAKDPSVSPVIGEVAANAQLIHKLAREAQAASEAISKAKQASSDAEAGLAEALTRIKGHEREASNAQTNASGSAASASQSKQAVDDLVATLNGDVGTQRSLIDEFEKNRGLVEETLQGASKIGLARSFSARRSALERSQLIWAVTFIMGLLLLFFGASFPLWWGKVAGSGGNWFELVVPSLGKVSSTATTSVLDAVIGYISHVLLLGPGIWLTWFAARKYGQLSRLAEDYAFKEAAALAFVGYRAEMGGDNEMLDLLRRTAIETFGANPVRVLAVDEPASPIHDALLRILKKTSPDKLAEVLKEVLKGARG